MNALQLILNLVAENLDFFSFREEFNQKSFKKFSELAMLFHYADRNAEIQGDAAFSAIRDFLTARAAEISPDDVFKNAYTSYHVVMPYAFIRHLGLIPPLEKALELVCDERFFSPEIPPHRQMEWDLMLFRLGRRSRLEAHPDCILRRSLYLPYLDRELAYALTHAVFYLTDFGFHPARPDGIDIDKTLFRIACLIARFSAGGDVDVSLELMISFLALYPFADDKRTGEALLADITATTQALLHNTHFLTLDKNHKDGIHGVLEEKYHTFFVLGILHALLCQLEERGQLPAFMKNSLFLSPDIRAQKPNAEAGIEALALTQAWRIIDSLKGKSYSRQPYDEYQARFGRSAHLEAEIEFYLGLLLRRNRDHILWNREFELLRVPDENQATLTHDAHQDFLGKLPATPPERIAAD